MSDTTAAPIPAREMELAIASVEKLNDDVYRILLSGPASGEPAFLAGQYLQLLVPGVEPCAFSIASSPSLLQKQGRIELHFRAQADNPGSDAVLQLINTADTLRAQLPYGQCHVGVAPEDEVILVAGSTGFAQVKSIAEHLLEQKFAPDIHLYWGGRQEADLYLAEHARSWAANSTNLTFHPVLSAAHTAPPEDMRDGWLHQAILEDFESVAQAQLFVSGSPGMVYSVYDSLVPYGASRANFHSDVFAYAPRDTDAD